MAQLLSSLVLKRVLQRSTLCSVKYFSSTGSVDAQKPHYDVIIAGGGLVGVSLAVSLAKNETLADKKILLLEGAPPFKGASKDKYSNRVSAINKRSVGLLKKLDAWSHIESVRCKPVMQMQVWDALSGEMIHLNHPNFSDQVACIIENDLILESLYNQLADRVNVEVKNLSRLEACKLPKDGNKTSEVTLKTGEEFTCDLLVGADGANSIVRQNMNVNNFALSYNQMGVVATLEINADEASGNSVAWQRFLPTGPVALLPLTDNLSSLVWSTTVEHAKELLRMEPEMFIDALNDAYFKSYKQNSFVSSILKATEGVLPMNRNQIQQFPPKVLKLQEGSRAAFPLGFGHASSYVCGGAALIGDAAHRVHPLAGQGVNLGFGDVVALTEVLAEAIYNGSSLDNLQYLMKYEKQCLKTNVPILVGVHTLQNLYCTDFPPVVLARSLGLKITNNFNPIKQFFMNKAIA